MRALGFALLAACATTSTVLPKGGPRGLRASDHLDAAHQHETLASQRQVDRASFDAPDANGVVWLRTWDPSTDHDRLAAVHRSEAALLQAEYEEACGARPIEEVSISPLQRYGTGAWPTSAGVIVYLDPSAGGPDKLLAEMKCHRAWMMLAPSGMEDCPLDLPGLVLDARGDNEGITVSMIVRDPKLVEELHRRAAHELEVGTLRKRAAQ
jgi:hypothetical protein